MIKINIPKSSSNNFKKAVRLAKLINDIEWNGEAESKGFSLELNFEQYALAEGRVELLFELAGGWKGFDVNIDGEQVNKHELKYFSEVVTCSKMRDTVNVPETHCMSGERVSWGCKFVNKVSTSMPRYGYDRYIGKYRYWYQFGKFNDNKSEWLIDKMMLADAVYRDKDQCRGRWCPHFIRNIDLVLEKIPDSISLHGDSAWEIVYDESAFGNTISKKPIEISPKVEGGGKYSNVIGRPLDSIGMEEGNDDELKKMARIVPSVSFDDIGGIDGIIDNVREVIELPLKHPSLIKHLGITPHKGILLFGEPGCGKTLIAKAVANEVNAHFISIRGPEIMSKWMGESEENLRNIFDDAAKLAPSIIFFDEIDSIARHRTNNEFGANHAPVVNQLLTLMDGMETYENVCVIASTNRPDIIDEAVKRPGRFDYLLEVPRPTRAGCLRIFEIHSRNMPVAEDVDFAEIGSRLFELGASGATIAFLVREAAYFAMRRSFNTADLITCEPGSIDFSSIRVEASDFNQAFQKVRDKSLSTY